MATYYTIDTTLDGETYSVDYWPDGDGTDYYGYVTSLRQYRDALCEQSGHSDFELYYRSKTGRSNPITDDDDLRKAVYPLPNCGSLVVKAVVGEGWNENESDDSDQYGIHHHPRFGRAWEILKHFTGASGSQCYYCYSYDCCYQHRWHPKYVLCRRCYYYSLDHGDRHNWVDITLPWHGDAPDAPLYRVPGNYVRDEVCHLQYLLTRFGFMSLDDTSKLVGSYQGRTEIAVHNFRTKYHIFGGDMTRYNKRAEIVLGHLVRKARAHGHPYL